jgi:hypothetical protein
MALRDLMLEQAIQRVAAVVEAVVIMLELVTLAVLAGFLLAAAVAAEHPAALAAPAEQEAMG